MKIEYIFLVFLVGLYISYSETQCGGIFSYQGCYVSYYCIDVQDSEKTQKLYVITHLNGDCEDLDKETLAKYRAVIVKPKEDGTVYLSYDSWMEKDEGEISGLNSSCYYKLYAYLDNPFDGTNAVNSANIKYEKLGCAIKSNTNTFSENSSSSESSGNCDGWIGPGEKKTLNITISVPIDAEKNKLCGMYFEIYGESDWVVQNITTEVTFLMSNLSKNVLYLMNNINSVLKLDSVNMKCYGERCVFFVDTGNERVKITDSNGDNKGKLVINSLDEKEFDLLVSNLDNKEICGYIGSQEPFVFTQPQK